ACSTCNTAKSDQFPLDPLGGRLLLEPCQDDPLDYFEWDLLTGATGLNSQPDRYPLASNTRDMIDLDRESIREERRFKIENLTLLLELVVRQTPVQPKVRSLVQAHLSIIRPHLGIVRQLFLRPDPAYRDLIREAQDKLPEIRKWIAPWL